jgi:hypothetical protein
MLDVETLSTLYVLVSLAGVGVGVSLLIVAGRPCPFALAHGAAPWRLALWAVAALAALGAWLLPLPTP